MNAHPPRRTRWVRFVGATFMLGCLAFGASFAADLDREIPVARDRCGSELKVEITRDGARQTATPTASIAEPTMGRIKEQIERRTGIDQGQADSGGKAFESGGTPDREITTRDARCLFRALHDAVKARRRPAAPASVTGTGETTAQAAPPAGSAEGRATVHENPTSPAGTN